MNLYNNAIESKIEMLKAILEFLQLKQDGKDDSQAIAELIGKYSLNTILQALNEIELRVVRSEISRYYRKGCD